MNIANLTIKEVRDLIIKKEISTREVAEHFLQKIEREDREIGAFLEVNGDLVRERANKIDQLSEEEKKTLRLIGAPLAVKDNILVKGMKCTAGSKILENYLAPYNATVIENLEREGAIILGKTNLDEFAMGSSCENSAFFPTKNPLDKSRVAGGSSGGSAAAVAGGLALGALGSDTGGSIRLPASFCGVVGFKPSYGAVSRYGLIALSSSLDQIGPLAKTVDDVKEIFKIISGRDPKDATSWELDKEEKPINLNEITIGLPKEFFAERLDKEIEREIQKAVKMIEKKGVKIKEISLPLATEVSLAVYYIIMPSEASANLARYDGIRYGRSERENIKDVANIYFQTRGKYFGSEVKRRIMLGTFALSSGYYDAYYLKAQRVRKMIAQDFEKVFQEVDFLLTPSSPTVAFKIGEKKDPLSMYLSDIYMTAVNLAGLPAISLPWGEKDNLPVGLQIIGNFSKDMSVLEMAKIFEEIK